jgi:hypothetical protein
MNHVARYTWIFVVVSGSILAVGCGGGGGSSGGNGGSSSTGTTAGSGTTAGNGTTAAATTGDGTTAAATTGGGCDTQACMSGGDCPNTVCNCKDGTPINTTACNNMCCGKAADICPDACKDNMGWSG